MSSENDDDNDSMCDYESVMLGIWTVYTIGWCVCSVRLSIGLGKTFGCCCILASDTCGRATRVD